MYVGDLPEVTTSDDNDEYLFSPDNMHLKVIKKKNLLKNIQVTGFPNMVTNEWTAFKLPGDIQVYGISKTGITVAQSTNIESGAGKQLVGIDSMFSRVYSSSNGIYIPLPYADGSSYASVKQLTNGIFLIASQDLEDYILDVTYYYTKTNS